MHVFTAAIWLTHLFYRGYLGELSVTCWGRFSMVGVSLMTMIRGCSILMPGYVHVCSTCTCMTKDSMCSTGYIQYCNLSCSNVIVYVIVHVYNFIFVFVSCILVITCSSPTSASSRGSAYLFSRQSRNIVTTLIPWHW